MSGVYQRNREVSEYKFFTQAIAIRVEVNKLMASSSVVPKAYRLLNAVPTVETARSIVYNVNRADCFYPNSSFNALERKRYLTLAIADCEQLMLDMQCLMVVVKPCRDSITRERRKLKKMARMVADGIMTPEQVEQSYQSWRGGMKQLDAHRSVRAMDALYRSLFGNPAGGVAQCNPNLEATRMGTCPYPSNGRSDP
jgi:hypothetical protein